ncbi:unnamed protein product [Discula destructiva]
MASNDIRDVLNLPTDGLGPRPSKKQKVAAPRPNLKGLAREVQNLGGDNPIRLVPDASYKKRRLANRKPAAKWELRPFRNSARQDQTLVLRHWKRKPETEPGRANGDAATTADGMDIRDGATEDGEASAEKKEPEIEDSAFAKFNVKIPVPEYNDEQYAASLQSDEWTKDETDYLMEVVKENDRRWPHVWDKYDYTSKGSSDMEMHGASTAVVVPSNSRAVEDLQARYYKVAAVMMEVHKPKQYMDTQEYALYQMMLNFDPEQERQRKKHATIIMNRSKEDAKEEESLLIEAKRIMARAEQTNRERLEIYERLDYTPVDADKISQFQDSAGLNNLLGILQNQSIARKKKTLPGPDAASPAANGTHGQPSAAASEAAPSRRESIAAPSATHREAVGAEKPAPAGNNKKGQPPTERRVLSDYEKQIYGVSQHERLSSGPTYRYDRVNKLFAHKSNSQQFRIQGVLNVLGIPPRLHIATATVVAEYEKLVASVTSVVEMRKHKDKLLAEVKIEEAKKAERAKAKNVLSQLDGAADEAGEKKAKNESFPPADSSEEKTGATNGDSAAKDAEAAPAAAASAAGEGDAQPDGAVETPGNKEAVEGDSADQPTPAVKQEDGTGTRPSSSAGNRAKRSASVLSGTSDKGAKRQKK